MDPEPDYDLDMGRSVNDHVAFSTHPDSGAAVVDSGGWTRQFDVFQIQDFENRTLYTYSPYEIEFKQNANTKKPERRGNEKKKRNSTSKSSGENVKDVVKSQKKKGKRETPKIKENHTRKYDSKSIGMSHSSEQELPPGPLSPSIVINEGQDVPLASDEDLSLMTTPATTPYGQSKNLLSVPPESAGEDLAEMSTPGAESAIVDIDDDDPQFKAEFNNMILKRRKSSKGSRRSSRSRKSGRHGSIIPGVDDGDFVRRQRFVPGEGEDFMQLYREDQEESSEEEIFENIKLQKDIIENISSQPWKMKRKLKSLRLAKSYVERYEGRLSKSHEYQEVWAKYWRQIKRTIINAVVSCTPWESRIKKIESQFGTVVSSYFTFLRWLFYVNIVLTVITISFIVIPEIIVGEKFGTTLRKTIPKEEFNDALNLKTIWDFEGYMKYSVLFYGYYENATTIGNGYRLPLAYLLAGLSTYIISFVIVLRRMAANARQSKLAMKDEQYNFSWKLYTSWDYMIGNAEAAKNKYSEIATLFREAIVEEQEKKKKESKMFLLFLRIVANLLVMTILASSCYAIVFVVNRSRAFELKVQRYGVDAVSWWEQNEVSIVMSLITTLYPSLFDLIGIMEKYHPRQNLRWQLARILVLYLMNLYTLIFSLYWKIEDIEDEAARQRSLFNATLANITVKCTYSTMPINATAPVTHTANCTQTVTQAPPADAATCWETMVAQEMFKLTVFDLVMAVASIMVIDFIRGVVVRYANPCCCWDMEKQFPEYGEFKIAENLLHLVYNQGMIWMGTFFAPLLPGLNLIKLLIMLYVRSWAVLMCNVPHERVFKASKSNNFYYALLLIMLFLSTLPVAFFLVQITPSASCGPFSGQERIYDVLTDTIKQELPYWVNEILNYVASPGVIIPLIMILVMIIYYLTSLTRSLKEANDDLRVQLHYERTEEKRKVFAMADARRECNDKKNGEIKKVRSADSLEKLNPTETRCSNPQLSNSVTRDEKTRNPALSSTQILSTPKPQQMSRMTSPHVNAIHSNHPSISVQQETRPFRMSSPAPAPHPPAHPPPPPPSFPAPRPHPQARRNGDSKSRQNGAREPEHFNRQNIHVFY